VHGETEKLKVWVWGQTAVKGMYNRWVLKIVHDVVLTLLL
jgi:hypothetical protein